MSQTKRRRLLFTAGAMLAAPFAARAQPRQHARVAYLSSGRSNAAFLVPFLVSALGRLGWSEGRNLTLEKRFAEWQSDRLPVLLAELLSLRVHVIVIPTDAELEAARRATDQVPIVMTSITNPIRAGLAKTLAHPIANVTGVLFADPEFSAKSMQILRELVPGLRRLGTLYQAGIPTFEPALNAAEVEARARGIEYYRFPVRNIDEVNAALAEAKQKQVEALRVVDGGLVTAAEGLILDFAASNSLPTSYTSAGPVERGALMTYAPSLRERFAQVAALVDKILRGAKPADLPFEYPTRYELVVNLKTAKALGITVPQSILLRADRVIE
jgi:ABC-type uncharacterized transport system substrate-binding protein